MSDAESASWPTIIKANGMQEPIVVFEDNSEASNGSEGPFLCYLLDGRNRRDALRLLGIEVGVESTTAASPVIRFEPSMRCAEQDRLKRFARRLEGQHRSGHLHVLSMNVRRRIASDEQRRPSRPLPPRATQRPVNRKVAKDLGVSDAPRSPTSRSSKPQHNIDHSPVERAKQEHPRDNPALSGPSQGRRNVDGPGHGRQSPQGDR